MRQLHGRAKGPFLRTLCPKRCDNKVTKKSGILPENWTFWSESRKSETPKKSMKKAPSDVQSTCNAPYGSQLTCGCFSPVQENFPFGEVSIGKQNQTIIRRCIPNNITKYISTEMRENRSKINDSQCRQRQLQRLICELCFVAPRQAYSKTDGEREGMRGKFFVFSAVLWDQSHARKSWTHVRSMMWSILQWKSKIRTRRQYISARILSRRGYVTRASDTWFDTTT